MSNPTFDDVAGQAFDEVTNSNPASPETTPQVTEQPKVEQVVDKPQVNEEETFTKFNPNELPDELKPVYKSLQADYTRKRQTESARLKELEARLERLQSQGVEQEQTFNPYAPANDMVSVAKKIFIEQQEEMFDTQAQSDYPTLDSRLNEENPIEYDENLDDWLRSKLTSELEAHVDKTGSKIGFDYKTKAKDLIGKWDSYVESLNKAYIAKQSKIAKSKEDELKKMSPKTTSSETVRSSRMSLTDAIESAFE